MTTRVIEVLPQTVFTLRANSTLQLLNLLDASSFDQAIIELVMNSPPTMATKKFGKKTIVWVTLPSGRKIRQVVWVADKKTCPPNCQFKEVPVPCKSPPPPPSPCQGAGGNDCCGSYGGGPLKCFNQGGKAACEGLKKMSSWSNVTYCGKE